MRCTNCGFENPDRSSFCNSCGKELPSHPRYREGLPRRNCVSCGRTIPDDANVCPYCGHDFRLQYLRPQAVSAVSEGMKILFYILSVLIPIAGFIIGVIYYTKNDPESRHIGKMCIILAAVGIVVTVGISAVLYVLVFGFGDGIVDGFTPATSLTKQPVIDGVKFTFVSISTPTTWSDVTIILSDGYDFADWSPSTSHLDDSGAPATERFVPVSLGTITVFCNITDLSGNGEINGGDFFTLTTGSAHGFSASTTYTITIVYDPTGGQMCNNYFTG